MVSISYKYKENGEAVGTWPGKSVRTGKTVRKVGQIYLGKVVDKKHNIFYTEERGFYTFNPDDQSFSDPPDHFISPASEQKDKRKVKSPVIVGFGDMYFLHNLIKEIGYDKVIESIEYGNRDTLKSIIAFYTLNSQANYLAKSWSINSFASFLYPRSNISSQRISDMLRYIGKPFNIRNFLISHLRYVLSVTDDEFCIIIDSTGIENKCDIPATCISNHGGETRLEFRIIAVVQKSTGLPIFYELISGNIVDITTLERTISTLKEYGCSIKYCIGDAGYCCPSIIEKLIFSNIDFMTRLSPTYKIYKEAINNHFVELDNNKNVIKYRGRLISVVKIKSVVARNNITGEEKFGFIYLCKDLQMHKIKSLNLYERMYKTLTIEEILEKQKKFGVFAIISSIDMPNEDVLPEYYTRQSIEQYFDVAKNYAKYLPVRQHNMETLQGHLLVAFISSFIISVIKNRLNILDSSYIKVPNKLSKYIYGKNNNIKFIKNDICYIEQEKRSEISGESPEALFFELGWIRADVYRDKLIPTIPNKRANEFLNAFGLSCPTKVKTSGNKIEYYYKKYPSGLTREVCFSSMPTVSDEEINVNRLSNKSNKSESQKIGSNKKGRILGSNNKKTKLKILLIETLKLIYIKNGGDANYLSEILKVKRRGRKKGCLNKKTLLRAKLIEILKQKYMLKGGKIDELIKKREKSKGGRPAGSLNKKTKKRIELINLLVRYKCKKIISNTLK